VSALGEAVKGATTIFGLPVSIGAALAGTTPIGLGLMALGWFVRNRPVKRVVDGARRHQGQSSSGGSADPKGTKTVEPSTPTRPTDVADGPAVTTVTVPDPETERQLAETRERLAAESAAREIAETSLAECRRARTAVPNNFVPVPVDQEATYLRRAMELVGRQFPGTAGPFQLVEEHVRLLKSGDQKKAT
jgi:hypothetical protein